MATNRVNESGEESVPLPLDPPQSDVKLGKIKPEAPEREATVAFILQIFCLICHCCFLSIAPLKK